jgi:hypothetical protein
MDDSLGITTETDVSSRSLAIVTNGDQGEEEVEEHSQETTVYKD